MRNFKPRKEAKWALLLGVFLLCGTAARAEPVLLTCPVGTEATNYSPGITNAARKVNFSGDAVLGPCTGLSTGVVFAKIHSEGQGQLACSVNGGAAPSRLSIVWSDGTSSVATGQTVLNVKTTGQLVLVLNARVTSGRFPGANIVRTLTLAQTALGGCSTSDGVKAVAGVATLTVTGL
jgi:hypothetical protein